MRYLASGETQQSLSYSFRIGRTTVSNIISENCEAIFSSLKGTYLNPRNSPEDWKNISLQFEEKWNFPHTIGAIEGKHIRTECSKNFGTLYCNYKSFFSIVLLAVCDANYCFTLYDLGSYGSNNDSGILLNSEMGRKLEEERMNLPIAEDFDGCNYKPLPYYLLGDRIFLLKPWLMRSFPGKNMTEEERVCNYRQSRGRRTIENTFGILVTRCRIFVTPIRASVHSVEKYVLACLSLHNYLMQTDNAMYTPTGFIDSENRVGIILPGE